MKHLLLLLALVPSFAFGLDGIQVCVDTQDTAYTVQMKGFARKGEDWSGVVSGKGAIPENTDLHSLKFVGGLGDVDSQLADDLYYKLKPLVTPTFQGPGSEEADFGYEDEPRIYQVGDEANGVKLLCSSTMSQSEYESLAK